MDLLWERGPSTVAEVRAALGDALAYTTVLTVLRNLEAKRAVGRFGEGRAHRYFAAVARENAQESAVQRLLGRFFSGSPELLLSHLVEARRISPEQVAELSQRVARERQAAEREERA